VKCVKRGKELSKDGGKVTIGIVRREFGDINTNEVRRHTINYFCDDIARQGASKPILHCDKGLIAQKALDGLRGREQTPLRALKLG